MNQTTVFHETFTVLFKSQVNREQRKIAIHIVFRAECMTVPDSTTVVLHVYRLTQLLSSLSDSVVCFSAAPVVNYSHFTKTTHVNGSNIVRNQTPEVSLLI